ncbi:Rho GTPase activation protein [Dichotomocladium elegans]|nr:Rho GTPase activation protein [Dichotomocladium elegans]
MALSRPLSESMSLSSSPSSTSSWQDNNSSSSLTTNNNSNNSSVLLSRLADTMRDTRIKVEAKTLELNATVQEKLPEWKSRGALYGTMARETGLEWSRRGKIAVDRWKRELSDRDSSASPSPLPPPLPSRRSVDGVFGMPLEHAVALTRLSTMVPAVVQRCIDYLDEYGVGEVGIYRITGSMTAIQKLRASFDAGWDLDFEAIQPDPHVVSALLKTYLREYGDIAAPSSVRMLVSRLPPSNLHLLRSLCRHLKNIADHESVNRMSVSNLAVVFIPTLNIMRSLFHCMIEHYSEVFAPTPPPIPQKPRHIKTHRPKTLSDPDVLATVLQKQPPAKPSRAMNKPASPPVPILHHQEYTPPLSSASSLPPSSSYLPESSAANRFVEGVSKPRSKSMSATTRPPVPWRRPGSKVEAIGRQFETRWNQ